MSLLSTIFENINDAIEEDRDEARECAQRMVAEIGFEVGVNVYDAEDVWSHDNMLRVVRAVQGMRTQLAVSKGYPQSIGGSLTERLVPLAARGW